MIDIPKDVLRRADDAYRAGGISVAAYVILDHLKARLWVHPRPELLARMIKACGAAEHLLEAWSDDVSAKRLSELAMELAAAVNSVSDRYTDLEDQVQATLADVAKKAAESERKAVVAWLEKDGWKWIGSAIEREWHLR